MRLFVLLSVSVQLCVLFDLLVCVVNVCWLLACYLACVFVCVWLCVCLRVLVCAFVWLLGLRLLDWLIVRVFVCMPA